MVRANGIRMRIAEEGDPSKPLVLLMHGWPEFWPLGNGHPTEKTRTVVVDMNFSFSVEIHIEILHGKVCRCSVFIIQIYPELL